MNSKRPAFVIALVLSLAALLGLAWAANVEDELKKLETDRAAAVVKGDVVTLEKQTSNDYTQKLWASLSSHPAFCLASLVRDLRPHPRDLRDGGRASSPV